MPDHAEHQMVRYKAEAAAGGIIRMLFRLADDATVPVDEMIGIPGIC